MPKALDRTRAGLYVFSLYGFAANPDGQRANARWEVLAAEQGFLVVYPQGSSFPLRWNVGPQLGLDDVQWRVAMLDALAARRTIDPARVCVSGLSDGGHMTHLLACPLADRVAAVGTMESLGADGPQGCRTTRPVPVKNPFTATDPMAMLLAIPDWLTDIISSVSVDAATPGPKSPEAWSEGWAERNGCGRPALTKPLTIGSTLLRYGSCAQDAEVVSFSIPGRGHAWPGRPPLPRMGETTSDIDATRLPQEFFNGHPLPSGGLRPRVLGTGSPVPTLAHHVPGPQPRGAYGAAARPRPAPTRGSNQSSRQDAAQHDVTPGALRHTRLSAR